MNVKELKEFIKDLPDEMLVAIVDSEYPLEEAKVEMATAKHWDTRKLAVGVGEEFVKVY